jgi:transposase InsO family protein
MARMRQMMRQFVWWPGMDSDVQKHVSSCTTCLATQPSRANCNLSSWPDSNRFFQRLFIDICFYQDKQFLVVIDHFSSFMDVHLLSSLNTQSIINALNRTYRYFGLPDEIVCDNGRQFVSSLFHDFLRIHNIELRLTPLYHSQSNGKVERAIRTFKLFLNKNTSKTSELN